MNILVTAAAGSGEVFAPLSLQNISIERLLTTAFRRDVAERFPPAWPS